MESPRIISSTIQEFQGERFYLCGNYFQHNGKRLHRTVYRAANGEIPEGSHIHHKDGDRGNNSLENLELLSEFKHLSLHAKENPTEVSPQARLAAAAWHGSEDGRKWHSRNGTKCWEKQSKLTVHKTCQQCGEVYETYKFAAKRSKFCHANCKATALRARRKAQAA